MPERPHGLEPPRGLTNTPRTRSYDGRFGRLFQKLADQPAHDPVIDLPELREIATSMRKSQETLSNDKETIPAGYTYLGQFVDHDITFDPVSQLDRRNDPEGLINFRTPRFDLDSIYGSGPVDEPFQYDPDRHDGFALLLEDRGGPDLPRIGKRAAIGDPRNDENGIISQLHVAFLKFHNAVLDHVAAEKGLAGQDLFEAAQRLARGSRFSPPAGWRILARPGTCYRC